MKEYIKAVAALFLGSTIAGPVQADPSIDSFIGNWIIVDDSGAPLPMHDQANLIIDQCKLWITGNCSRFRSTGPLISDKEGVVRAADGISEIPETRVEIVHEIIVTVPIPAACQQEGIGDQLARVARNLEFHYAIGVDQVLVQMPNGKRLTFARESTLHPAR